MTRVTLENIDGLYIIESPLDGMTVEEMYETFLNPIMLAATYHPSSINEYFLSKAEEIEDASDFPFNDERECDCGECSCAR